jgi:hypothetical protein
VQLARFRKPKAACFLSYVEYRPNTNTSNIMKNRSYNRSYTRVGGQRKEVKKVNMVEEYRIFKPVEITIRRGSRQKGEK